MELVSDEELNDAEGDTLDDLTPVASHEPQEKQEEGVVNLDSCDTAEPQGGPSVTETHENVLTDGQPSTDVSATNPLRVEVMETGGAAR